MAREKFDPRELTEVVGEYISPNGRPPEAKLYRPITPLENWKLKLDGKAPYWIPQGGMSGPDILMIRPRINIDNPAAKAVTDGGPVIKYESNINKGLFDVEWEYVDIAGGATVRPGLPKVPDISRWEDYIEIPDFRKLDYKACGEMNKDLLASDKMKILSIYNGIWERLMSLCDVDRAAIALVDEDQKPGVHRFFEKLTNMYIDYINGIKEHCDIDTVFIHDDWGHQNGPFFSLDTAREMLVPYLRKITDHCHSLGLFYEHHSCGQCEQLVQGFIEAGVDLWRAQPMNDIDMLLEKHSAEKIVFSVRRRPDGITADSTEDQLREIAYNWVEKYKDKKVVHSFENAPPQLILFIYEYSRKAYQDAE